ncbi:MAG: YeeE/YedE thiosulfate transporter family protein [Bacillota bacterium]
MNSLLAVFFGILFGFILQRAGALEYKNILKTLRLIDLRIAKFMFLSVGISTIGVFSLRAMGMLTLDMIKFNLIGTTLGGLIFGVGFAVTGYCPGTCIGAWAEGKKDAAFVILGGIMGVLAFTVIQNNLFVYLNTFEMGELMLTDFISLNTLVLGAFYSMAIGFIVYAADYLEIKIKAGKDSSIQQTIS